MEVTLIQRSGDAVLAECVFDGTPFRRVVPFGNLVFVDDRAEIDPEDWDAGIDYGIDWEAVFDDLPVFLPENFALEMRKRNIWTVQDAQENPNEVLAALQAGYGLHLGFILNIKE